MNGILFAQGDVVKQWRFTKQVIHVFCISFRFLCDFA